MKHEAEGAFVRSRIKYKLDGEKPWKLFCSLEKQYGTQRYVPQLVVEGDHGQEHLLKDQNKIETEICSFYTNLFSNKDSNPKQSIQSFLGNSYDSLPKLSENQKNKMEGNLSLEEISKYLKKCKNNVAPGSSGFTFDFYKFFWRDIKHFVIKAINFAFDNDRLSVSQRLGVISIIPKGEKDKRYQGTWVIGGLYAYLILIIN